MKAVPLDYVKYLIQCAVCAYAPNTNRAGRFLNALEEDAEKHALDVTKTRNKANKEKSND